MRHSGGELPSRHYSALPPAATPHALPAGDLAPSNGGVRATPETPVPSLASIRVEWSFFTGGNRYKLSSDAVDSMYLTSLFEGEDKQVDKRGYRLES